MWTTVKLRDVCTIKTGRKDVNEGNPNGEFPFFTCAKEHTFSDVFSFDCEAILIAGNGAVGQTSYFNGKFEAYQRTYVLTNFTDILPKLLLIILQGQLIDFLSSAVLGNTMPYIKKGMLEDFQIPLPPLPVQKQIAEKLDATFTNIDKAISATQKNIKNAEALFQKLLHECFSEIELIGETKNLNEVSNIVNGGTPKSNIEEYWDGDIPWLTPKDMGRLKTRFVDNTERKITIKGLDNSSAKLVKENSIIFSCRAPIGHLNINRVRMAFNQGCKAFVPKKELNIHYLYYFLMKSKEHLQDLGSGTTFKEISSTKLKSVTIPLVKRDLQKQIVEKFDAVQSETTKIVKILEDKVRNLNALKSSLLHQAFSGELTKEAT